MNIGGSRFLTKQKLVSSEVRIAICLPSLKVIYTFYATYDYEINLLIINRP